MFRSLLIPLDLAPDSARVTDRAAVLPLAEDARLTLLHVISNRLPRDVRARAGADARKALAAAARSMRPKLRRSVTLEQVVAVGTPPAEIAKHATAIAADLVVMSRGGGRGLRDLFLGSTAERVIRQGQRPVLVVRLPVRGPYRRPLLALDLDEAAPHVLALALRLIPPPRPRIALVHAYEAPFHGVVYPSLSPEQARRYRQHHRQKALATLDGLLATASVHSNHGPAVDQVSWKSYVHAGSPRTIIPKTVAKARADVLALGTHGYAGVAHAFLGTVAGDVLRRVPCDVLVVPPRRIASRAR